MKVQLLLIVIATTLGGLAMAPAPAGADATSRKRSPARKSEAPRTKTATLPARLAEMIAAKYDREDVRANLARLLTRSNQAFESAWPAYQRRVTEVKAGVERADALFRAGKLAEAQSTLISLVTRTPLDERGRAATRRHLVEPRDAELAAIKALVPMVSKTGDYHLLTALAPELLVRRTPGDDKEAERWMWFAYRNAETLANLGAGQSSEQAAFVAEQFELARRATQEGPALAHGILDSLQGVKRAFVGQKATAKAGEWIAARIDPPRFEGKAATTRIDKVVDVPYDCRDGKVIGVDLVSGKVIHAPTCKHKKERVKYSLALALEEEPPAGLTRNALFIGKVEKGAPAWKIARAHFPDLRWAESPAEWKPSEYEYIGRDGKQTVFPEGTAW